MGNGSARAGKISHATSGGARKNQRSKSYPGHHRLRRPAACSRANPHSSNPDEPCKAGSSTQQRVNKLCNLTTASREKEHDVDPSHYREARVTHLITSIPRGASDVNLSPPPQEKHKRPTASRECHNHNGVPVHTPHPYHHPRQYSSLLSTQK